MGRGAALAVFPLWALWPHGMTSRADSTPPPGASRARPSCAQALAELPKNLVALDSGFTPVDQTPKTQLDLVMRDSRDVTWEVSVRYQDRGEHSGDPDPTHSIWQPSFSDLGIPDRARNNQIINRVRIGNSCAVSISARHGREMEPRSPELSPRVRRILETIERQFDGCQALPEKPRALIRCLAPLERAVSAETKQSNNWQLRIGRLDFRLFVQVPRVQVDVFALMAIDDAPALGWHFDRIIDKAYSADKLRLSGYWQVKDPDIPLGFVGAHIVAQGPEDEPRAPPVPPRLKPLVEAMQHALDGCLGSR